MPKSVSYQLGQERVRSRFVSATKVIKRGELHGHFGSHSDLRAIRGFCVGRFLDRNLRARLRRRRRRPRRGSDESKAGQQERDGKRRSDWPLTRAHSGRRIQPTPPPPPDENAIVVTGIRQSLRNSQQIKRNSDTVVDAITAQDIGALPDRSVTEALQRVPGVVDQPVRRHARSRSLLGRRLGRLDPRPELRPLGVQRARYLLRRRLRPVDQFRGRAGRAARLGRGLQEHNRGHDRGRPVRYRQHEHCACRSTTRASTSATTSRPIRRTCARNGRRPARCSISDTWDTGDRTVGLLGAFSYSRLFNRSDGVRVSNFQTRNGTYSNNNAAGARHRQSAAAPAVGHRSSSSRRSHAPPARTVRYGTAAAGANGFADLMPTAYTPVGGQFQTEIMTASARGIARRAVAEPRPARHLDRAVPKRTESTKPGASTLSGVGSDLSEYNTFPAGCQQNGNGPAGRPRGMPVNRFGPVLLRQQRARKRLQPARGPSFPNYTYGANNVFESGYITLPGTGWRTAESGSSTTRVPTGGMQQSLDARQVNDQNIVQDIAELQVQPDAALGHQPRRSICDGAARQSRHGDFELELRRSGDRSNRQFPGHHSAQAEYAQRDLGRAESGNGRRHRRSIFRAIRALRSGAMRWTTSSRAAGMSGHSRATSPITSSTTAS